LSLALLQEAFQLSLSPHWRVSRLHRPSGSTSTSAPSGMAIRCMCTVRRVGSSIRGHALPDASAYPVHRHSRCARIIRAMKSAGTCLCADVCNRMRLRRRNWRVIRRRLARQFQTRGHARDKGTLYRVRVCVPFSRPHASGDIFGFVSSCPLCPLLSRFPYVTLPNSYGFLGLETCAPAFKILVPRVPFWQS
jgi:hypothetical protein